jgi:cell division protein FtsI (penicillin-binding protein 3)
MPTFSKARAFCVFTIIVLLFGALAGRVAYLQTYGREQIVRRAERQQHQIVALPARRGGIFDRNGMLMAGTVQTQTLFIDPKFLQDEFDDEGKTQADFDAAIAKLAGLLDKKPEDLAKLIADKSESRFVKVATHLDDAVTKEILKLDLPGVGCQPSSVRNYPMGSIAAHILGGMGGDGHGLEGLEMKMDKLLSGRDGRERVLKDARRRPIDVASEDYLPPVHGSHLVLTIDTNIQMIAEEALAEACEVNKAKRGEVVVMDPYTGEILALANWPTFNPQNLEDSPPQVRRNACLVMPYEPGSTIKPFIAGPALAQNITHETEIFHTGGAVRLTSYGRRITDVHNGYPQLCMWDVLVKSSNIGMSLLGERMGNTKLYEALRSFKFGERTGIELPGEDPGNVRALSKWSHYSTDSIPQGYELEVTPLQLARGFCAYANGGKLINPTIIKGTLDPDGNVSSLKRTGSSRVRDGVETSARGGETSAPDTGVQIINPVTAAEVRRILADVPVRGTAAGRGSKVYNISGKTGTAHIVDGHSYSSTRFNSSFIGLAPYENPRLVVALIVHDPDTSIAHYGGVVSAPHACKLLERALAYLQVPASPELPLPPPAVASLLYNYHPKVYEDVRTASAAIKE